jgi:riboflavin transporter FmnP
LGRYFLGNPLKLKEDAYKKGVLFMSKEKRFSIRKITLIAVLSAMAAVVMFFKLPLPFAPPFYKLDFSEVIVLIGAFSLGPLAGVLIEFIKVAVNTFIEGTTTNYIWEAANFIMGCSFIVPASIIYRFMKNRKGALIGMAAGTLSLMVIAGFINYFVIIPLFSRIFMPLETIINMGAKINANITDLLTLIIFATLPFNLFKGVVSSIITFIVYKRISPLIKGLPKD